MTQSVLFVCMGNICRSPTGEAVMSALVAKRGLASQVAVDSAGTIGYHSGNRADSRMRGAAARRGYDLLSRARQVTRTDLDTFDLVVAMDSDNLHDLQALGRNPAATIKLLADFLDPDDDWPQDVPDPYYGGPQGFEYVLDMIEAACPAILDELLRNAS